MAWTTTLREAIDVAKPGDRIEYVDRNNGLTRRETFYRIGEDSDGDETIVTGNSTLHADYDRRITFLDREEPKPKTTMSSTLTALAKKLLDPSIRTLVKAGYLDDRLELTTEGHSVLTALCLSEKKDELVKLAEEKLAEEKE